MEEHPNVVTVNLKISIVAMRQEKTNVGMYTLPLYELKH